MAKKGKKLNSMRLLERHDVAYKVHEFSTGIHSAVEVATAVGKPAEQVYKTLVVQRLAGKPLLAVIPGPATLDLKALANAIGEKKLTMAAHTEAEKLTGLKVGGISPLALMPKGWMVVVDSSIQQHDTVLLSAGQRGTNLEASVAGLLGILRPTIAKITR